MTHYGPPGDLSKRPENGALSSLTTFVLRCRVPTFPLVTFRVLERKKTIIRVFFWGGWGTKKAAAYCFRALLGSTIDKTPEMSKSRVNHRRSASFCDGVSFDLGFGSFISVTAANWHWHWRRRWKPAVTWRLPGPPVGLSKVLGLRSDPEYLCILSIAGVFSPATGFVRRFPVGRTGRFPGLLAQPAAWKGTAAPTLPFASRIKTWTEPSKSRPVDSFNSNDAVGFLFYERCLVISTAVYDFPIDWRRWLDLLVWTALRRCKSTWNPPIKRLNWGKAPVSIQIATESHPNWWSTSLGRFIHYLSIDLLSIHINF